MHMASSIQTNSNTLAPQVPPTLRPTFSGNYSSEAGLSQRYFRREITKLFGCPCRHGDPAGTRPTATASDYKALVLHQQAPRNLTQLDGVRGFMAPRPAATSEPLEGPRGPPTATRQLPDMTGTPQVVPDTNMRPRDARP